MTKAQYIELIGESPEDMFGPDWKNQLQDLEEIDVLAIHQKKDGIPVVYQEDLNDAMYGD